MLLHAPVVQRAAGQAAAAVARCEPRGARQGHQGACRPGPRGIAHPARRVRGRAALNPAIPITGCLRDVNQPIVLISWSAVHGIASLTLVGPGGRDAGRTEGWRGGPRARVAVGAPARTARVLGEPLSLGISIGAAAVAGIGLYLYLTDDPEPPRRSVLTPLIAPSTAGAALSGSF